MTIGDKIYKLRNEKGLSQEALAEKLGVSRQSISKWETNQSIPDLDRINGIVKYFNVSLDYLINDSQEDNTCEMLTEIKNNDEKIIRMRSVTRAFTIALICIGVLYLLYMLMYIILQNKILSILGYNYRTNKFVFPFEIVIYNALIIAYILVVTIFLKRKNYKSVTTVVNSTIIFIGLESFLLFVVKYISNELVPNYDVDLVVKYQLLSNVFTLVDWIFNIIIVLFLCNSIINSIIGYLSNYKCNKRSILIVSLICAIILIIIRVLNQIYIY